MYLFVYIRYKNKKGTIIMKKLIEAFFNKLFINNWMKNIKENLIRQIGEEKTNSIFNELGTIQKCKTQTEKDNWLKQLFNKLTALNKQDQENVMEKCGHKCLIPFIKTKAIKAWKKTNNIELFIELLNQQHIGGGYLEKKGDFIYAKYKECLCPIVNKSQIAIPAFYCDCSRGWFKELFETVFNKQVKVEQLSTIKRGDDCCSFKILIP